MNESGSSLAWLFRVRPAPSRPLRFFFMLLSAVIIAKSSVECTVVDLKCKCNYIQLQGQLPITLNLNLY